MPCCGLSRLRSLHFWHIRRCARCVARSCGSRAVHSFAFGDHRLVNRRRLCVRLSVPSWPRRAFALGLASHRPCLRVCSARFGARFRRCRPPRALSSGVARTRACSTSLTQANPASKVKGTSRNPPVIRRISVRSTHPHELSTGSCTTNSLDTWSRDHHARVMMGAMSSRSIDPRLHAQLAEIVGSFAMR